MGTRPWSGKFDVEEGADRPAEYISWNDIQTFIQRLNQAAGDSLYRLPTEAEWEYACRAGTTTPWSSGDDERLLRDYAWFIDNAGIQSTHRVGTKRPNSWGLHDMHGNAWEWVQNWYSSTYYSDSPAVDPQGPDSGTERVMRGGDADYSAAGVRSAKREASRPTHRYDKVSFRLVRVSK